MLNWSLSSELMALVLTVVLILFFYDRKALATPIQRLYWVCLWLTLLSIPINVISVFFNETPSLAPRAVSLLANNLYFLVCIAMSTAIAYYLFRRMLEHVYDRRCLRRAEVGLGILCATYALLLAVNLFTGIMFCLDEQGYYQRGPLYLAGYLVMLGDLVLLVVCYFRNRKSVSLSVTRIIRTVPPIMLLLAFYQFLFPEQLLNGTMAAVANFIIFISFQSRKVELDSLTGIGNRHNLVEELALHSASGQGFQIIALVLRQFDQVNQKYGHTVADALLCQCAQSLQALDSKGDAFRMGNMEFVLLLPCAGQEQADANLERVQALFRRPWRQREHNCTLQAGCTDLMVMDDSWLAADLVEYLKYALHLIKVENHSLLRAEDGVLDRFQRHRYLVKVLDTAIERRAFQVWYQPIFHRTEGQFRSAEALVRLQDSDGQFISPSEFIPVAEETGQIGPLSWIVLEQVCRFLHREQALEVDEISVNLSLQQFLDPTLADQLDACLARHQIAPSRLKLEITERVLPQDGRVPDMMRMMDEMRRRQLQFHLDDFGTGYSNLALVLSLPFAAVKLDRSLLTPLSSDGRFQQLVRTLILLFQQLGLSVVAEGVETEEQAKLVMDYGADRIQGFHYAKPMPEGEFLNFLRQHT